MIVLDRKINERISSFCFFNFIKSKAFSLFLIGLFEFLSLTNNSYASSGIDLRYQNLGEAIIQTFPNDKFYGHGTNWSIQQHTNGMIFVSNDGFHSFDGSNWRTHHLQDNSSIRQFAIHPDGRIYFGSDSAFGFFESAINGELILNSLEPELNTRKNPFRDIYNVYLQGEKVVYISPEQIMIYLRGTGFEIIKSEQGFSRSWKVKDKIFFADGKKLKYLSGSSIVEITGIAQYDIKKFGFVEAIGDDYLIGTYADGIYLLRNGEVVPWLDNSRSEAASGFTGSLRINKELIAVSSIHDGVLFFNTAAEVVYRLNRDSGLPTNITLGLFLDAQQGLWVGQQGSLSRAQLPFNLSVFASSRFDIANVHDFVRIENKLYLSAINGVQVLESNGELRTQHNTLASVSRVIKHNNNLIIGGSQQCQVLDPESDEVTIILLTARCRDLHISQQYQNTLFIMTDSAVFVSYWNGQRWHEPVVVAEDVKLESLFVEDATGVIWNSIGDGSLLKIWPRSTTFESSTARTFNSSDEQVKWQAERIKIGDSSLSPLVVDGKLLIATDKGLFDWLPGQNMLVDKTKWYHEHFGYNAVAPYLIHKDKHQRLWLANGEQNGYFDNHSDGKVDRWVSYPIAASGMNGLRSVFEEHDLIWLGFDTGVVRYKPLPTDTETIARAYVSEVILKGQDKPLALDVLAPIDRVLNYDSLGSSLRVYFGLSNYLQGQNNQYRYQLNDSHWSKWSNESFVDLGELSGGYYQLNVQALDPLENIISAKPILLSVRPPWYASGLAYSLYVLILIVVLYSLFILLSRAQVKRLLHRQHLLEQQVAERTKTIQKQSDELARVNQAKTRFFANVSHEFRTPLTLAIGPLKTLLKLPRISHPQDKQYLRIALENSEQMLELVGQLLDINRLESGQMPLQVSEIDPEKLIRNCISRFQLQAKKQQLEIKTKGLEQPIKIWMTPDHLQKIITNLLSNALKFSSEGSVIEVGLQASNESQEAIIWVKDQGSGIPTEDRAHLFERFFQGKNSSFNQQPGTGIGLSMVKELLELHQGHIELDHDYVDGCLFRIILKLGCEHYSEQDFVSRVETALHQHDNTVEHCETAQEQSEDVQQHRPTVLVVDDNKDIRLFVRNSLQSNYQVVTANNGQNALQQVRLLQPDFIVSDIMMPVMDGLSLTKELKANPLTAHIPLLLLTAKSTKRETVEGLQVGADDYLSKPFDSSELAARIAAHLQQKKNIANQLYQQFISENVAAENTPEASLVKVKTDASFELKFKELVTEKLSEPSLDVAFIASALHMERSTLFRKMKKAFNCTPNQYIKNLRLATALQMLQVGRGTISEVAYSVGFQSLNYFSRSFTERYNVTPSEYKKTS